MYLFHDVELATGRLLCIRAQKSTSILCIRTHESSSIHGHLREHSHTHEHNGVHEHSHAHEHNGVHEPIPVHHNTYMHDIVAYAWQSPGRCTIGETRRELQVTNIFSNAADKT